MSTVTSLILLPSALCSGWLLAQTATTSDSLDGVPWSKILDLGLTGVIIFIVVRWALSRIDAQHMQNEKLIASLTEAVGIARRESDEHRRVGEELIRVVQVMRTAVDDLKVELRQLPSQVAEGVTARCRLLDRKDRET